MQGRAWLAAAGCLFGVGMASGADAPAPPVEKPGWRLTFQDEFDRPRLNDRFGFAGYRSGRKVCFRRQVGEGVVEIDIFEQLGKKIDARVIDFNVHVTQSGAYEHTLDLDPARESRVWALEWQEGRLDGYLDGRRIRTCQGESPKEKMFILLGLYQGAVPDWAGPTDPDMPYPRDFESDYVRANSRE